MQKVCKKWGEGKDVQTGGLWEGENMPTGGEGGPLPHQDGKKMKYNKKKGSR
jgi:hypothetical protein